MSDQEQGAVLGKLLERVARVCVESCEYPEDGPSIEEITKVLEERLGPLLRAGQDCRDGLEPGCQPDDLYAARYDAALNELTGLATLESRDGK